MKVNDVVHVDLEKRKMLILWNITHTCISLAFLWDMGKQYSPRCDAAECGVTSGAILFA